MLIWKNIYHNFNLFKWKKYNKQMNKLEMLKFKQLFENITNNMY